MLSLIDWRREIFEIYSDIRTESDGKMAWEKWRVKREELFKHHPESPTFNIKSIPGSYAQPILYPYNPNFCLSSKFKFLESSEILELITDDNSITRIQPFLETTNLFEKLNIELTIFKILGYGGGLFLPFFDKGCFSNGENYEGGRYLIDTIKGADLGECKKNELRLDFNFSYNPSCSYNSKWTCPIIKNYNNIPILIDAGEKKPIEIL